MKKPARPKRMRFAFDLHVHSTWSDGTLTPVELVALAAERGVLGFALTDHDTTRGLDEAHVAAREHGIQIIDGIEVSAWLHREVHILGYFIDPHHGGLARVTRNQRAAREVRLREICRRLAEVGAPIDPDRLLAEVGMANIGRPHIAAALVSGGYARDPQDAFDRLLGNGKPGYVPASRLSAADAISIIHQAGGVAVLAHPGVDHLDASLPQLAAAGLDGIECNHPAHDRAAAARYFGLARRYDLQPTGGSDFHRPEGAAGIGTYGLEPAALAELKRRRRVPGATMGAPT